MLTWIQDLRYIFSSFLVRVPLVGPGDIIFNGNYVMKSCHVAKSSIGNQQAPNEASNA